MHVLARVVIHMLAHVLLHVLAPFSTILARVVIHVLHVLYFKLPGAKKKQNKHKHDIMDAVDNARGAEKKHWWGKFLSCLFK